METCLTAKLRSLMESRASVWFWDPISENHHQPERGWSAVGSRCLLIVAAYVVVGGPLVHGQREKPIRLENWCRGSKQDENERRFLGQLPARKAQERTDSVTTEVALTIEGPIGSMAAHPFLRLMPSSNWLGITRLFSNRKLVGDTFFFSLFFQDKKLWFDDKAPVSWAAIVR